ncbi:MAG: prolyl aminopeptidase [Gammaproteobacteria bacterium]|nr:prolyl aminopeptidase [Pseudomonadales bacterium]MCP5347302.1 prolyl aminopeptidase [Pseudomonadales bacterium]
MLVLYPELKPYSRHQLRVSDLHELYVDEAGNPDGIPVLFVHGGPGSACNYASRRYYDPETYRIITFDQRGCGRSTPHAELRDNDTQSLIADMETIRRFLDVDSWVLFGGSWGSTLSLLYAQAYPDQVLGMVLRGIFLCRQADLDWLYVAGASRVFPDHWRGFVEFIPEAERQDLVEAYYRRLTGADELARMAAAKSWAGWEIHCSRLRPSADVHKLISKQHNALAMSRIESHYFINKGFIEENQILNNLSRIQHIPARIIHGRYDMVCPLDNATALHERWGNSELVIIRDAGHSATEPGIIDALVRATGELAEELKEE